MVGFTTRKHTVFRRLHPHGHGIVSRRQVSSRTRQVGRAGRATKGPGRAGTKKSTLLFPGVTDVTYAS